jgi:DNA-binding GntR family transcriptional regulator
MAEPSGPVPARTPPVTPQRETVVTHVRRAIVLGELRPGDKLREVALAASLGVSRATLREALNLLVQDGLLVQQPYRGFGVTRLEPGAVRDLARTRVPLDLIAVEAILDDDTGHRRQLVRDAWAAFDRSALDPDPLARHEAHVAFHRGLWVASENSMLLRLWPVTEALTTIALAQEQATRADPQRAHTLHRRLVDAVLGGDLQAIRELLQQHTVDSAEEFLELYGRPG